MIRRPPRSTQSRSSAASDVYKRQPTEGVGLGSMPVREALADSAWFGDHFEKAATEVIDFLTASGIGLTGRDVADIGAGDGIIDLGVALKAKPARLVCFDITEADPERLLS